jgi:hypothetical protein
MWWRYGLTELNLYGKHPVAVMHDQATRVPLRPNMRAAEAMSVHVCSNCKGGQDAVVAPKGCTTYCSEAGYCGHTQAYHHVDCTHALVANRYSEDRQHYLRHPDCPAGGGGGDPPPWVMTDRKAHPEYSWKDVSPECRAQLERASVVGTDNWMTVPTSSCQMQFPPYTPSTKKGIDQCCIDYFWLAVSYLEFPGCVLRNASSSRGSTCRDRSILTLH